MNLNINTTNINNITATKESPLDLRKLSGNASDNNVDILGVCAATEAMPNMTSTVVTSGNTMLNGDVKSFENELANKAKLAKDNLTNLFNKLTTTDLKSLDDNKLGSLTDTDIDKVTNVVEEIKIMLATYCEDYIPTGNIDIDEIKEVTGNASMAAKVVKKFHENNIPVTRDNVYETMEAISEIENTEAIDTNSKRYLIRNSMEPTIDNVYKAVHSVSDVSPRDNINEEDLKELNAQIEKVIKDSGLEVNENSITNAKLILKEGMPLDKDMLMLADSIDKVRLNEKSDDILDMVVNGIIEGRRPGDVNLDNSVNKNEMAHEAYKVIVNATSSDIIRITNELLELNISNIQANVGDTGYRSENEEAYIKNFAILEHARLTLNAGALFTMDKLGVKLDNTSLMELTATYEQLELNTSSVISELHDTPVDALSLTFSKTTFTLRETIEAGASFKWKAMMAGETYETFGTQIRGDLGDSLKKAVNESAEAILAEYDMSGDKNYRAAVNILAANSMELTPENISRMAEDYRTIMSIATKLSPRMVMDMIREKISPLTTDVHLLNEYVDKYDRAEENRDSYAKFLYKLEVSNSISEEERTDYIGIYRVLNNIAKDEGKSIGATVKAGEELILENVIKHYISRRHGKIDASIGEDKSYQTGDGTMSYYTKIFRNCVSLEEKPLDNSYYEQELENMNRVANAETDVLRLLTDNAEPVTIRNVIAALDFKGNKIYRKLEEIDSMDIKSIIRDIYDTSEDEAALNDNLEKLVQNAEEYGREVMENNLTYGKIKDINEMIDSVKLLANLGRKKEYKIPVYDNGKLININLKLVSGDITGRMNITFEHEKLGNVSVNCNVGKTNFDALLASDSDEGIESMDEKLEGIKKAIAALGYEEVSMNVSKSTRQSALREPEENKGSTAMMYKAARTIISALI